MHVDYPGLEVVGAYEGQAWGEGAGLEFDEFLGGLDFGHGGLIFRV